MTHEVLGIDVGGSSVKAALVDVDGGQLVGELISATTPQPATPDGLMPVIAGLVARLPQAAARVGVAFPTVVKRGRVHTAANIDPSWGIWTYAAWTRRSGPRRRSRPPRTSTGPPGLSA